jgi:hypothetical protein
MSFTTGLGLPTMLGRTEYYIEEPIATNQWDEHTWANIYFDNSGSMSDIITPLTNVMVGAYCGSGSAADEDCVKSTEANFPSAPTLRAELQDYYASGATEESGNTNNATNGKDAYDAHVIYQSRAGEKWLQWIQKHGTTNGTSTASETWETLANAQTVNNVVQVCVVNESKGWPSSPIYHRTQFGNTLTMSWTQTVNGATSSSATLDVDDGDYLVRDPQNTTVYDDAATRMYITAVTNPDSSSGSFNANTYIDTVSSDTVTLANESGSALHSFQNNAVITFTIRAYGWNVIGIDGLTSYTAVTSSDTLNQATPDTGSPDNHPAYVTDIDAYRAGLTTGTAGFKGVNTSGQTPSLTLVVVDSGLGLQRISGYNVLQPVANDSVKGNSQNAAGSNRTASQRFIQEGVIEGLGDFATTRTDANNYSLQGFNDTTSSLQSWNGKNNLVASILLDTQNANTSQAFWYNKIKTALSQNINF